MAQGLQKCVCLSVNWYGQVTQFSMVKNDRRDLEGPIVSPQLRAKSSQLGVSSHQGAKKCIKKSILPHTTRSAHKRSRVAVYPSCLQKPSTDISQKCLFPANVAFSNFLHCNLQSQTAVLHGPAWGQVLLEKQRFLSFVKAQHHVGQQVLET